MQYHSTQLPELSISKLSPPGCSAANNVRSYTYFEVMDTSMGMATRKVKGKATGKCKR